MSRRWGVQEHAACQGMQRRRHAATAARLPLHHARLGPVDFQVLEDSKAALQLVLEATPGWGPVSAGRGPGTAP